MVLSNASFRVIALLSHLLVFFNNPVCQLKGKFLFQFILSLRIRVKEHPTLLLLLSRFRSSLPHRLNPPSPSLLLRLLPILSNQLPPHLLASQR